MAERWPAAMRRPTAAEYMDLSPAHFDKVAKAHGLPSFQYTERGDRYYLREDLDAMIEAARKSPVGPRAA